MKKISASLFLLSITLFSCKKDPLHVIDGQYLTTMTQIQVNLNDTSVVYNEPVDILSIGKSNSIQVVDYLGQYMDMVSVGGQNSFVFTGSGSTNVTSASLTWYPNQDSIIFTEERFAGVGYDTNIYEGRKKQ